MEASLRNSAAYGTCKNIIRPAIINALSAVHPKAKCVLPASNASDKFKPITFKMKEGGKVKDFHTLAYLEKGVVAIGLFHMMNAKNIAFISNGQYYLIDGDVLRANWNSLLTKVRKYTDGNGLRSSMSYMDPEALMALAYESGSILPADVAKYNREVERLNQK